MKELQIGDVDVPEAVWSAAGHELADLIGKAAASGAGDMLGPRPHGGWRVVSGDLLSPDPQVILAAPWHQRRPGSWMLLRAGRRDGAWWSRAEGAEHLPRHGRAHRRAGLTLQWLFPLSVEVRDVPRPYVRLHNATDRTWYGDGQDNGHVRGRARSLDGSELPTTRGPASFRVQHLPSLPAGAHVDLHGCWDTAVSALPDGRYSVQATLCDLQLLSDRAELVLR